MADETMYYNLHATYVTKTAGSTIGDFDRDVQFGTAHAGKAVTEAGEDTVELAQTGDPIDGKLIKLEPDGFCVIQDGGYCDLPTDGTAITYGKATNGLIGGATAGTVKSSGAAAGANTRAIKGDGTGKVIAKIR